MVNPAGAVVVVNHLVELHRLLVAEGRQAVGRQAIPGTLEVLDRQVLPEEAVMATAMIMAMGNERVRTRRNQMVKVLKVKRKKLNQR